MPHLPATQPGVIATDRRCRGCGYRLQGLKLGGVCPECGLPIVSPRWVDDPMSSLPAGEIRPRRLGGWIATVSFAVMMASISVESVAGFQNAWALAALPVGALGWTAGMFLLTGVSRLPQAAVHGFSPRGRLRRWAWRLQTAWIVAGVLWAVLRSGALSTAAMGLVLATLALALAVGIAGLVVAALAGERLAEWVRDDIAQRLFNACVWGVPFGAVVAVAGGLVLQSLAPLALGVGGLVVVAALAVFPFALLLLTRSLTYAVAHAEDNLELEHRRERRRRKDAEIAAARVRAADRG